MKSHQNRLKLEQIIPNILRPIHPILNKELFFFLVLPYDFIFDEPAFPKH